MAKKPIKDPKKRVVPKSKEERNAMQPLHADGVPNGFTLQLDQLEKALRAGQSRGLLEDYFGPQGYSQLHDLAREESLRSVRGGPRVLILPGIMGSRLAKKALLGIEDILWINPIEIVLGRLMDLKLSGAQSPYHEAGVILLAYLKLKLKLRIAGFDADFFAYDWRLSLADLGKALADAIRQDSAKQLSLVAHSMGGLVARAALPSTGQKVAKLIMLGTPNYGSFAPVQVLRGTYDVVQKILKVDRTHTPEQLCGQVFNTFPGLYEMLPSPDKFNAVDLYKMDQWPRTGPAPRAERLAAVKPVIQRLAPADERFYIVVGVNQDTVTGLSMSDGEFHYEITPDGDGTVPLNFARLAGIDDSRTYYVEESHGSLPNNGTVETAVSDLLSTGRTGALPNQRPASRRGSVVMTETEFEQRAPAVGEFGSTDYRHLLDAVAAPPKVEAPASALPAAPLGDLTPQLRNVTIGRQPQRRLDLTLAHGGITEVDSRVYLLGVFKNIAPSGAAKALDDRLEGAVAEFTARRMFSGEVGSIFTLPVGRNQVSADMVLFAGMGAFDQCNADVLQLLAENVIRMLVRSRVDEFATILIGAGSGQSTTSVLRNLVTGFLRGLKDADPKHRFRGITLCENDAARFAELKSGIYQLAGTPLFEDIEVTLSEVELPAPVTPRGRGQEEPGQDPVYAIVRQEAESKTELNYRVSILSSGMKAAVVSAPKDIKAKDLALLLAQFDAAVESNKAMLDVTAFGKQFADLVLPDEVRTVLESMKSRNLVVVHDAPTSRIPWETLIIDGWSVASTGGLSRHYMAEHLPIATWLEERRMNPTVKLLLVVNPLGDLPNAEEEGTRILELEKTTARLEVTTLRQKDATKAAVLSALRSGKYDCVHYAGHAFFDPIGPGRSGLICAGREVLSGADMTGLGNLPFLIFFNACEAGRIRGKAQGASDRVAESAGVAEALMRGGLANYLSTYWPVGDNAAATFASTFYQTVLEGGALGTAVLGGRQAVLKMGSPDWADYILYGNADFVLKRAAK
jgi:pimeloyl-ACP methyl ester carboxylesterase